MGIPNLRKNSCMFGSISAGPVARVFSVVRMLTTAGPTLSTKLVKSGRACACADCGASDKPPRTGTSKAALRTAALQRLAQVRGRLGEDKVADSTGRPGEAERFRLMVTSKGR